MKSQLLFRQIAWLALGLAGVVVLAIIGLPATVRGADSAESTAFIPVVRRNHPNPVVIQYAVLPSIGDLTVTAVTSDGSDRLFVATQKGRIFIIEQDPSGQFGTPLPTPFLDVSDRVISPPEPDANWEEGFLGVVFHPDYATNGTFFVTFTEDLPETAEVEHDIVLARYRVDPLNPNRADPASRETLLHIAKPLYQTPDGGMAVSKVHNAGDMHFGPDGYLYVAVGDGGPDPWDIPDRPADRFNNGQALDRLLGKILRIDVDSVAAGAPDCGVGGYRVPLDNPFRDGSGGNCDEIWSRGWRNPWRFSIDPLTGDLYISDVGEFYREEINHEPAGSGGRNYGWRCYEGTVQRTVDCDPALLTFPVYEYANDEASAASVIGGYVVRSAAYPSLNGRYLFTDFEGRAIQWLPSDDMTRAPQVLIPFDPTWPRWTTFGQDAHGDVYLGALYNLAVFKIIVPDA